jgi:murein DD-endopeptidase MepM/ murein hydrolase activator NlpD
MSPMARVAWLAASLMVVTAASAATRTNCLGQVCLHVSQSPDYVVFDAENPLPVPVGVRIEFERLQNLAAYPSAPGFVSVQPRRSRQVVKLTRMNVRAPASYPFRWSWTYGDPSAVPDTTVRYRMPFGGNARRLLTQGQNGSFSHTGVARFSFDFGMPVGTPIVAAQPGRVVEVTDGHTRSGISSEFLDKANAVTLLHRDGTFATYAHLDPGAGVRPGMLVNVGEVIGFSGDTGYSTGPHLHFSVWKATSEGGTTIPIRFRHGSSANLVPREGVAYSPTCHRKGVACKPGELPSRPASWGPPPEEQADDGTCRCRNGAIITTHLPCRMVCP